MRALKTLTIAMGVAIIVATAALGVLIARRLSGAASGRAFTSSLDQPDGTRVAAIAGVQDRLAVWLQGGGADRVLLIDPRTGAVSGRILLPATADGVPR